MKLKYHVEKPNVDGFVVGLFMVSTKRMTSGDRRQKQSVLITWNMVLNWKADRSSASLWFVMGATECAWQTADSLQAWRCCSQTFELLSSE